jgi:hypothetical protein
MHGPLKDFMTSSGFHAPLCSTVNSLPLSFEI